MKFLNRIISVFFAVVITFVVIVSPIAQAAWYNDVAYYYTQSRFGPWAMDTSLQLLGLLGDVYVPAIPGIGTLAATAANKGINSFAEWLAAGHTEDELYSAESDYVSSLDTPFVDSSGVYLYYPSGWHCSSDMLDHLYSNSISSGYGWFTVDGYVHTKMTYVGTFDFWSDLFSLPDGIYGVTVDDFIKYDDSYKQPSLLTYVVYGHKSGDESSTLYKLSSPFNSASYDYFRVYAYCTYNLGSTFSSIGVGTLIHFTSSGHIYSLQLDSPVLSNSSTRPASFMQTINNYNEGNRYIDNSETVNYYIGTLDTGGDVTEIYNVNFYDEDTLVFTEPQTGTQYQTTGWTYDYTTRCYTLSLASGTMTVGDYDIDTVKITYGDDMLSMAYYSGDTLAAEDEYAYVRVAQSECALNGHTYTYETIREPTCTAPGERKYTCTVCGNEYAEEIPATGHTYEYSIYQEPTCTDPGIALYTCSVCGDQYTEPIEALGHDWLATEITGTAYALPDDVQCDCGGSDCCVWELDEISGTYTCTCGDCDFTVSAVITYGQTTYTCSRCGETYIESNDPESGLFASIGNFIANGIGWVTDKLSQLIDSLSGINDIFSSFVDDIKEKSGEYPAFLGAAIALLPEDLTTVIWFSIVAAVVLAVWKKWFH